MTTLPLPLFIRGKVREVYDLGDTLLLVASDRISAFDYVLPTPIPDKGVILNQLSAFWFKQLENVVPNHLISTDVNSYPDITHPFRADLLGRSMWVKKTEKINFECVVRGYLTGSGWKEYQKSGKVCGLQLQPDLRISDRLPEPIFTPATKEDQGKHDQNVSFEYMKDKLGAELSEKLRDRSLALYIQASRWAESKGLILCDTKFEFGLVNGEIMLIDEILTPDSSRFWEKSSYVPGKPQESFDKQFVRDYLESVGWAKQPPIPSLPLDVVNRTREKYVQAYERLTGKTFGGFR